MSEANQNSSNPTNLIRMPSKKRKYNARFPAVSIPIASSVKFTGFVVKDEKKSKVKLRQQKKCQKVVDEKSVLNQMFIIRRDV